MKKLIFKTFLSLSLVFLFTACENNTEVVEDTDNKDTVVVVQEDPAPAPTETPVAEPAPKVTVPEAEKPAAESKAGWKTMMNEYNEILCRAHKGNGTVEDKIRQTELSRELMMIRKDLPSNEQFTFTAEMARAANMETCK